MKRLLWLAAPLVLAVAAPFSPAKRIAAPPNPVQRALQSEMVVTGKVTTIEKEPIEIEVGGQKLAYRVAVIKIESALAGANNLTHVKVGFQAMGRGRGPATTLEENQEGLFFLTKHASGTFHTFNWMSSPVPSTDENYKTTLASVKRGLAAVADPMKALKAEKAEDRAFAAVALVIKYRSQPFDGGEQKIEKIAADESKLILKGLAEANWSKADGSLPSPVNAFYMLGLMPDDGWTPPKGRDPNVDFNETMRAAFAKWAEDSGKDYRVGKFVPKK